MKKWPIIALALTLTAASPVKADIFSDLDTAEEVFGLDNSDKTAFDRIQELEKQLGITDAQGTFAERLERINNELGISTGTQIETEAVTEEFVSAETELSIIEEPASEAAKTPVTSTAVSATTIDELDEIVEADVENTISTLSAGYETLKSTLPDFESYQNNPTATESYYNGVQSEVHDLCIRLREYALNYAEIIANSDEDFDDKYDDLESIYDELYDDAADEIYETIYDDLLDDMYDDIYNGIISDASDRVAYDVWDDVHSAEYSLWDDAHSAVYDEYDTVRSDLYSFYDKLRTHMYKENMEKVNKDITKFQKLINKLKGIDDGTEITLDLSTLDLTTISTVDGMDAIVEADVDMTVASLNAEYEALKSEINSYEAYRDNDEKTEAFYEHVVEEVESTSGRMRTYALRYAKIITESGMDYSDQYDELSDINDAIYTDAGNTLRREIYGVLLKDAIKTFYSKLLKTGYDIAPYSEVANLRSNEYSNVSDARSDVYSEISDMKSDIYDFTSDLKSETWSKDAEKITKVIDKFRKDTEKFNH